MLPEVTQFHIDLLAACQDDWESVAGAYSIALRAGLGDPVATRALAIELVTDALNARWVLAGDLTEDGFTPWGLDVTASVRRITEDWLREEHVSVDIGAVAWLDLTEEGEAALQSLDPPMSS